MIQYFDFQDNLTDSSPKNHLRAFQANEKYAILGNGNRVDNSGFNLNNAKNSKNDQIKLKRESRYKIETDPLLLEIQAMDILGQDTTAKRNQFISAYNKIKNDLELIP